LVTRWITYIRLFDFEVQHVPRHKYTAADGLSRRPRTASDDIDDSFETDVEDFIDAELGALSITPIRSEEEPNEDNKVSVLEEGYSEDSQRIAEYLTILRKPEGISRNKFRAFKKRALRYAVRDRQLFLAASKNIPSRLVVDSDEKRAEIVRELHVRELHDESGHKGRESTYREVADRYYWEGCFQFVQKFVASCKRCQFRDPRRLEEALYPTWSSAMFYKIGLDVIHMPSSNGKNFLVTARDDLSWWVESRALGKATSETVATFL
jgi:Integrase zinc binding domain